MSRLLILALVCASAFAADEKWNYIKGDDGGPAKWGGDCQTGKKQSPIDIVSKDAKYNKDLTAWKLTGFDAAVDYTLVNNGHTFKMNIDPAADLTVEGGGLDGKFKVAQFHVHWGADSSKGSEHLMNGKAYPMEVHFVTYNTKYADLGKAVPEADGLAVLGFFFEIGDEDNDDFDVFVQQAGALISGNKTEIPVAGVTSANLMGKSTGQFFRYPGSLTTPGCFESVTWTVFADPISVSEKQMEVIRAATDMMGASLSDNFRPVLALNDREVHTNLDPKGDLTGDGDDDGASAISLNMALMATLLALFFFLH